MIRLSALGGVLLILTIAALSLHTPGALTVGSPQLKTWFVVILGISAAVFLLAVRLVLRMPAPPRHAVWVVLLVAAAMRLPLVLSPPFLSTDVFRYVWDGRVQAAGINPYRYIPADPALRSLRDTVVYPNISRAEYAPTIYPPAAQVIFAVIGRLWSSVTAVKAVMVGFEGLAVACLLSLLAAARLPPERVLIYAWNPLPVWAFAGNGHIDAAAVGFVSAALLLRVRHRDGWSGVMLAAAALTKFLPAVLVPALWRWPLRRWPEQRQTAGPADRQSVWWRTAGWPGKPRQPGEWQPVRWSAAGCRFTAFGLMTVTGLYAAYSGVGWRVFGFLGGYGAEEGMDTGSGIWLLAGLGRVVVLPDLAMPLYLTAMLVLLAGLGCWFAFIHPPDGSVAVCSAAAIMMAALTFAISPHYPWYYAWLAVPSVLAPYRAVLWLSAAPILLYLDTFGDRFIWPSVVFAPALLLALADFHRPRLALDSEPIKGNT